MGAGSKLVDALLYFQNFPNGPITSIGASLLDRRTPVFSVNEVQLQPCCVWLIGCKCVIRGSAKTPCFSAKNGQISAKIPPVRSQKPKDSKNQVYFKIHPQLLELPHPRAPNLDLHIRGAPNASKHSLRSGVFFPSIPPSTDTRPRPSRFLYHFSSFVHKNFSISWSTQTLL